MGGQPPYTPFENDRVKWKTPRSEVSGPVLASRKGEDFAPRQPAVLLFLSSADSGNCCASNYERFIFRDQKVVKLAEQQFVVVRIDRGGAKPELLKRFKISKKRPSLLVVDCESEVFARWDLCGNASDVYKALVQCLKVSRKKAKVSVRMQEQFEDVARLTGQQSYRGAGNLLKKILRIKGGPKAGYARARRIWGEIEAVGKERLEHAMGLPVLTERYDGLTDVRGEFWFFDDVSAPARTEIARLEQSEETKPLIHEHKGLLVVAEAKELLGQGKKAKARGMLRRVKREFSGTRAAEAAEELLAKD